MIRLTDKYPELSKHGRKTWIVTQSLSDNTEYIFAFKGDSVKCGKDLI